ncbi:MAG TPA: TRAP transporter large permease subunit [Bacillales bacterium]|nr:TRAP transporter large permease subunit [Bacillales bacterium]
MHSLVAGIFMAVATLVLLMAGMPIAFALGIVAVATIFIFLEPAQFELLANFIYQSLDNFSLLAIPLFVLMGAIFAGSKASIDLFSAAQKWVGRLPGGLAISSVAASALFAALSGSSAATAAAIGKVAIPEMKKRGYSNPIATGAVVAGGTLGILIPPSVTLILYGIAVEQSIGQLFLGGIIPGIILTVMFCIWIVIATLLERRGISVGGETAENGPVIADFSWKDRFKSFLQVFPFVALLVAILVSLYGGFATPSEAAAVGAILALIMVVVFYRSMTLKKMMNILLESTKESTMILLIIAFSFLIGTVMSFLSIPQDLAGYIAGLNMNKWLILLFINLFLLLLGCFLLPVAIILMTAPIIYPIITALGFDPIWFGVIMTINMEMGLITPPVGLNLFVVKGIAPDIPTSEILKGSLPYIIVIGLSIVLFSIFPQIVTWLPEKLMG